MDPLNRWNTVLAALSERFCQKTELVSLNVPWRKKQSFFKKISQKIIQIILWIRRFRFWSSHWKFFGKRPKCFRSVSEKEWINYFLSKFFKIILRTRKCRFDNHVEKVHPKKWNISCPMSEEDKKTWFLGENLFLKVFLWKWSIKIFKAQQKKFQKRAQYLRCLAEFQKTCSFADKKQPSSKCSSGHIECSFDNRAKKFFQEPKIFSLIVRNSLIEKSEFFPKTNFSSECSSGNVDCSSETFTQKLPRKGQTFPLKVRYW